VGGEEFEGFEVGKGGNDGKGERWSTERNGVDHGASDRVRGLGKAMNFVGAGESKLALEQGDA
jgi:hypothetical protein